MALDHCTTLEDIDRDRALRLIVGESIAECQRTDTTGQSRRCKLTYLGSVSVQRRGESGAVADEAEVRSCVGCSGCLSCENYCILGCPTGRVGISAIGRRYGLSSVE